MYLKGRKLNLLVEYSRFPRISSICIRIGLKRVAINENIARFASSFVIRERSRRRVGWFSTEAAKTILLVALAWSIKNNARFLLH